MSSTNQPSQPEKMSLESMSITDHQKAKLKELFPEIFTEGLKIDFEQLKRTLGEMVDGGKERFGMNWAGKADCFRTIQQPSVATLVPCPEESIDFDTTENVFIEGDNLEVLKLLQKSYLGKIKMIYIDPPYNTGNDFIYPDNYSENLDTYFEYTGQIDGEGRKFSTNVDTDGRFHSKWMNMMYPRLFLAKNLLREDGVIFISIDDNEVKNLRSICDEVFGEENFVGNIVWQKKYAATNDSKGFSAMHDHIIAYQKSNNFNRFLLPRTEDLNKPYKNDDNDGRGLWRTGDLLVKSFSQTAVYPIVNPNTGVEYFPAEGSSWRASKETMQKWLEENRIYFGKDGTGAPQLKRYLSEVQNGKVPTTWWPFDEVGHNDAANKELKSIFGAKPPFDTPKPSTLIKRILQVSTTKNDLVLDFFAGSSTTAHAVMAINKEDFSNRKFICIQLPELCDESSEAYKQGYKTIAEISKERIRRVAAKIKAEAEPNVELLTKDKASFDLGFRVFKLQKSNFKAWDATLEKDATNIQLALEAHIDHIDPNATQQAILFELLLKAGFELTTPIETLTLANRTVFSIVEGALLICLEKELTLDLIKAIADLEPSRVIVLDEGFQNNDQLKTNASLTLKAKGVVDFRTV